MSRNRVSTVVLCLGWMVLAGCTRRPSDQEIAAHIKAEFYSDPDLKTSGLTIAVKDGEVTLAGGVSAAELQLRAFKMAYHTAGVNAIRDEMTVISHVAPIAATPQTTPQLLVERRPSKSLPPLPEPPQQELQLTSLPEPPSGLLPTTNRAPSLPPPLAIPFAPPEAEPAVDLASLTTAITTSFPGKRLRQSHQRIKAPIRAAGIQAPAPVFQDWFTEFHRQRPDVSVNYEALGAGPGIRQLTEGGIDLAASNVSLTKDQTMRFTQNPMQVPVLVYAAVPIYNLPGVSGTVNFPPVALAGIFLGEITHWNHEVLREANPNLHLPDREILVVHQSDRANADSLWTMYLSKISSEFRTRASGRWPTGMQARGDRGAIKMVRETPYAIGYADWSSTFESAIQKGAVMNAKNRFVAASEESLAAAALSPSELTGDGRISILNASGRDAYPISEFEWWMFPGRQTSDGTRDGITDLVDWVMTKRKGRLAQPGYAPLPAAFAAAFWERMRPR